MAHKYHAQLPGARIKDREMTALTSNMSLLALLKAGATIELEQPPVRFFRDKNYIQVQRFVPLSKKHDWVNVGDFSLTKASLEQCLEYVNLPI
jgi:hypothetical protein